MKKLLFIISAGILLSVNIYAKPRFDEDGTCYKCKGKGKFTNRNYSRKKMGSKKFIKCADCKATGKKPRKIDGKLLITKNRKRYRDYTIKNIDNNGITVVYTYAFKDKEVLVKPKYWPKHMQKDIAERAYIDSNMKLLSIKKTMGKYPKLEIGETYFCKGTPYKIAHIHELKVSSTKCLSLTNVNSNNLKLGHQQTLAVLIVGKINGDKFTAEILSKPNKKQLKAYFSGKPINQQIALSSTK